MRTSAMRVTVASVNRVYLVFIYLDITELVRVR